MTTNESQLGRLLKTGRNFTDAPLPEAEAVKLAVSLLTEDEKEALRRELDESMEGILHGYDYSGGGR